MNDLTRGGILGAATLLPATSAVGLTWTNHTQPWIIWGFIAVSLVNLGVFSFYFIRYVKHVLTHKN